MDIDEIYRAYFTQVYRYALYLTKDQNEAEEVTQETFFKAIHNIDRFRGETDIRFWLCRIAKNVFLDRKRREKKTIGLDQMEEQISDDDPESKAVLKDAALHALEALGHLPKTSRMVFSMRAIEGRSYADIARCFGRSENWARVTYYRAKSKLQEEMEHEGFM